MNFCSRTHNSVCMKGELVVKRIVSITLAVALAIALVPMSALAVSHTHQWSSWAVTDSWRDYDVDSPGICYYLILELLRYCRVAGCGEVEVDHASDAIGHTWRQVTDTSWECVVCGAMSYLVK